jgi:hypothetical protein
LLCVFVWKSKRIEKSLLSLYSKNWKIIEDKYIAYPKHNMKYRMYITKKK